MRTVKFRGKDETGKWIYGGVNDNQTAIVQDSALIAVVPETVGQFTELYDHDSKEIYENDILKPCYVKTGDELKSARYKGFITVENYHEFISVYRHSSEIFKVVGNIFDNPKLLGGQS